MNTIHVGGRRLGLESLATEGAGVVVGVWPDQQQAGQDTQQRKVDLPNSKVDLPNTMVDLLNTKYHCICPK